MERPYVICHILSSLNGKINEPFMGTEAVGALGAEYGKYRTKMNADAWLYGTTTTKEFTSFRKSVLERAHPFPAQSGKSGICHICNALFPFKYPMKSDTAYLGGNSTHRCT